MRGEIAWAGVYLSSLNNIIIEHAPQSNRPERKVDRYKVPGRNGDIVVPQNAWENVRRSYDLAIIGTDYDTAASELMSWLYAPSGYQRLTDSFDTAVYRRAYVSEETDIENLMNTTGRCTIVFECDPRRFLKTGETSVTLANGTRSYTNPTRFEARPVITVHGSGSGTITAYNKQITISSITEGMVIDCEAQEAYLGTSNLNSDVSGTFPTLGPGTRNIIIGGGITSIDMVPNWWTL